MTVSRETLAALGRLNASARGFRGPWNPSRAIYAYKHAAALALVSAGEAGVRFVRLTVKCGCDNGRWYYDHDDWRRCYYCSGTGKRALHFTETTLPDGQVWHHPWEGRVNHGYDIGYAALRPPGPWTDDIAWQDPGEWHPRQPALTLELDELVTLLNKAEDWVEEVATHGHPAFDTWRADGLRRFLHQTKHARIVGPNSHGYQLPLGAAQRCFVCGSSDLSDYGRFGCCTPLFYWTLVACKAHGKIEHPQIARRDLAPPDELIKPSIREWLARHSQVVEVVS